MFGFLLAIVVKLDTFETLDSRVNQLKGFYWNVIGLLIQTY